MMFGKFLLGSVWIELILLKLKTENCKHCSKMIFKYVNSAVGPIFNEKVDKKWSLWDPWTVHKCTIHRRPGQQLRLGRIKKKKKKKKSKYRKRKRRRANALSKLHLSLWIKVHSLSNTWHLVIGCFKSTIRTW